MTIETEYSCLEDLANSINFFPEKKLRSLCETAPVALFSTDKKGIFNYFEGYILEHFGLNQNSVCGTSLIRDHAILKPIGSAAKATLSGETTRASLEINNLTYNIWLTPIYDANELCGLSGVCIECSSDTENNSALLQIQNHYNLIAEYSSDIITKYTPDGLCTYASPSVSKILGYSPEELIGKPIVDYFHPDDIKSKKKFYTKFIEQPTEELISYRVKHANDQYIWMETKIHSIKNASNGELIEVISVSRDITERKSSEERLLYLANFDSLTGLPNRALFRDRLRRAVARAQRNSNKLALLFIDLDRFKTINDSLGHHAGDQLLRGVARRLKQFARKGDTIARLGGDEFTVILEGIEDSEDAVTVAEKILELMAPSFKLDGHDVVVGPSIGITMFPDDAEDMHTLLKNADTAMYRSKENGGNCFQFYTSDMNNRAYEYLVLENNLRHAIEKEQFRLFFQPQIDLHTNNIIGIEALLRWEHPEHGLLNPEEFVPFAEETGFIEQIGDWVLNNACREAKKWQNYGLTPVRVAVNLSMRQFVATNFVEKISSALSNSGLDAKYLELEITESFLAQNVEQTTEVLHELHALGVHLSIDDFGTGYSSLNYLKRFPLNTLKIDQSFVQDISTDPDSATIAEAIIAMGQSLRLNVIAEGVETEEQVFFLRGHGCDWVQGFLFSKPLPADKIVSWIWKNNNQNIQYEQKSLWPEAMNF